MLQEIFYEENDQSLCNSTFTRNPEGFRIDHPNICEFSTMVNSKLKTLKKFLLQLQIIIKDILPHKINFLVEGFQNNLKLALI